MRMERRLKFFENLVLSRSCGPTKDEVTWKWRRPRKGSLMICTPHHIISVRVKLVGSCECDNEPSGFIKCGEFLEKLEICSILKKDCAMELVIGRLIKLEK